MCACIPKYDGGPTSHHKNVPIQNQRDCAKQASHALKLSVKVLRVCVGEFGENGAMNNIHRYNESCQDQALPGNETCHMADTTESVLLTTPAPQHCYSCQLLAIITLKGIRTGVRVGI